MKNGRFILTVLSLVFLCHNAFGAIALDTSDNGTSAGANTITISGYTVTGSNTMLIVGCQGATNFSAGRDPTATWNGSGITKVGNRQANDFFISQFYEFGVSGSHDAVCDTGGFTAMNEMSIASFTGVAQSAPIDGTTAGGISDANSITITSVIDNSWGVGVVGWEGSGYTLTVGADQVEIENNTTNASHASSYETDAVAGNITISYGSDTSDEEGGVACVMEPYVAPAAAPSGDTQPRVFFISKNGISR